MTVDAARRNRRRTPAASRDPEPFVAPTASITIGEIDQTIFECPSCSRPLALGARRCPGCGTHLLRGVTLGKASGFIAVGLAVGLLAGAGAGVAFGLTHAPATPPIAAGPGAAPAAGSQGTGAATATKAPSPTATPTFAPTGPAPTDPAAIPPATKTALSQVLTMNGRLAEAGGGLRAALRAPAFDASAVAQLLRSVSADSIFGRQVAARVAAWPGSSAFGTRLVAFYGSVYTTASDGLDASVQNRAAYRAAATAMLKLLDQLPALDAEAQSAADAAGFQLPAASRAPAAP